MAGLLTLDRYPRPTDRDPNDGAPTTVCEIGLVYHFYQATVAGSPISWSARTEQTATARSAAAEAPSPGSMSKRRKLDESAVRPKSPTPPPRSCIASSSAGFRLASGVSSSASRSSILRTGDFDLRRKPFFTQNVLQLGKNVLVNHGIARGMRGRHGHQPRGGRDRGQ